MNERTTLLGSDVQARRPSTYVSLSRVGVTGVEKVIRIRVNGEAEQLFYAELECFVDLGPEQKGAHMSRFEEVVNEAIDAVVLREAFKAETLAAHIAELVRDRQDGARAEVPIAARYPETKPAPASGSVTQEIYTLFGAAVASATGTRRLVGVEAQGMTACPCAQEMVMERSQERLRDGGFTDDEITRVFEAVPVAHGRGDHGAVERRQQRRRHGRAELGGVGHVGEHRDHAENRADHEVSQLQRCEPGQHVEFAEGARQKSCACDGNHAATLEQPVDPH